MKKLILSFIILLTCVCVNAQNTNVQSEVKTTVKTVKDSDGEKKIIKTEELKKVQDVELKDADSKTLNKEMELGQTQVVSKVKVNVDGVSRYVDADRSGYYSYRGQKYQIVLDKTGYSVVNPNTKKQLYLLRETSNNNFIVRGKNRTSVGHFDNDGNLIIQTYNDKTDSIINEMAEFIK